MKVDIPQLASIEEFLRSLEQAQPPQVAQPITEQKPLDVVPAEASVPVVQHVPPLAPTPVPAKTQSWRNSPIAIGLFGSSFVLSIVLLIIAYVPSDQARVQKLTSELDAQTRNTVAFKAMAEQKDQRIAELEAQNNELKQVAETSEAQIQQFSALKAKTEELQTLLNQANIPSGVTP